MMCELVLMLLVSHGSAMLDAQYSNYEDIIDAVESIAERYFHGNCLYFFYLAQEPPDVVFSNLIQRMQKRWTLLLPIIKSYPGIVNSSITIKYIKCSYIISVRSKNYASQIKNSLYLPWFTEYRVGDSPYTRFILVVDGEVSKLEAYEALKTMFRYGDIDVVVIGREKNSVSAFTLFPFGQDGGSCPKDNKELTRLAQWEDKFPEVDYFPEKVPFVFKGCDFPVSTVEYPPTMFSRGKGEFSGFHYEMLGIITEEINVSMKITLYDRIDGWFWFDEEKNIRGSLNDLRDGIAWVSVAGLTNNPLHYSACAIETPYAYSKLMWYYPNPLPIKKWKFVYLAFSKELWIYGIVTAVVIPFCFFLFAKVTQIEHYFVEFERTCFTLWSMVFANSTGFVPETVHFRFILVLWLIFTMHLNLSYTASLTGLITGGKMEPKVYTLDDILNHKLTPATFIYMAGQLAMIDEPEIKRATSNYIIVNNYDDIFATMTTHRNLSIIDNNFYIDHSIFQKKLAIYRTPVTLLYVPTGIMMRRNHFLYERIDNIVQRLVSAGIGSKLVGDFTIPLWKNQEKNDWKALDFHALAGPFFFYACGISLSFTAFVVEIIYFNRKTIFNLLRWPIKSSTLQSSQVKLKKHVERPR